MHTIYDEQAFFDQYAQMLRSRQGLAGAGEWHQFRRLLPDLADMTVLDLGCGYGWHCKYAADQGARRVLGLDLSEKMLDVARRVNAHPNIAYRCCDLEAYEYPMETYDCVISNLALHYIADLTAIYRRIYHTLKVGGVFVCNIEHPVFTAGVGQDWVYDDKGKPKYWPVDDYFHTGARVTRFLGHSVTKQHRTLTEILMGLIHEGFSIQAVEEAKPDPALDLPEMHDELRRPMMLLFRVAK